VGKVGQGQGGRRTGRADGKLKWTTQEANMEQWGLFVDRIGDVKEAPGT